MTVTARKRPDLVDSHLTSTNTLSLEPASGSGPRRLGTELETRLRRFVGTPEEVEARQRDYERRQAEERKRKAREVIYRRNSEREARLRRFEMAVGARYRNVSLDGFAAQTPEERQMLERLREYVTNIEDHIGSGDGAGVFLFGRPGTGKTHVLASLARMAIERGVDVHWVEGADLFAEVSQRWDNHSADSFVRSLFAPPILVIDDLAGHGASLKDWEAEALKRIATARYRECLPTWIGVNVAKIDEARARLSPAAVDRFIDSSIIEYFGWPSYRQPADSKTHRRPLSVAGAEDAAVPPPPRQRARAGEGEHCYQAGEVSARLGSAAMAAKRKHSGSGVPAPRETSVRQ